MKKILCFVFCFMMIAGFSQDKEVKKNNEDDFIKISKFNILPHYFGFPLSVKFGWLHRENNVSVFPNAGIFFSADNGPAVSSSIGMFVQKDFFKWNINAFYDFVPFTMHKKVSDQIFYARNDFIFVINKLKISFPARVGRRNVNEIKFKNSQNELKPKTVTELSQGIRFDVFLADLGYFKATTSFSFFTDWIPESRFINYRLKFELPVTFKLYYVDVGFVYTFYNTDRIKSKNVNTITDYEIEKSQESMTRRFSFKDVKKYSSMHIWGTELRWYAARTGVSSNGFFISAFADAGFGSNETKKLNLIAEFGLGAGYTLFDNVPFTFQAGVNQDFKPVFFLGVVSRIIQGV
ncbi:MULTISPECIES: hypothetical protein [unclassified Treponema]|uniref:hypothetical protein n=1 Tax=unclassified Treponema TaxID=2638727 RepID=UPI0020A4FDBA|nr:MULTISPECIES: hypothetical protein [unclassified Treponema]UTC66709.1 hypothetical protein E4O06_12235 [Treponema sp. OMZ 789]UTC69441.1 hypothetical protein E4O01_12375 [Treponema sp. OMZ 790]UTC72155.1 hypothetical protein E4O02_12470 [Treponema sp. OMZ 791]